VPPLGGRPPGGAVRLFLFRLVRLALQQEATVMPPSPVRGPAARPPGPVAPAEGSGRDRGFSGNGRLAVSSRPSPPWDGTAQSGRAGPPAPGRPPLCVWGNSPKREHIRTTGRPAGPGEAGAVRGLPLPWAEAAEAPGGEDGTARRDVGTDPKPFSGEE